jgi:eukaryotic-like serine/threonine-protein kinase
LNYINDWSPDGRFVMFTRISAATLHDLWLLPIDGERTPKQFLKTQYSESHGQFSPDGKWIAYTSNESGRSEIYVQPLSTGVSTPVSSSGGGLPRWRRDGKELFYRGVDGRLMAVSVRAVPTGLEFGVPTALFPIVEPVGFFAYPYDVTPDGQRILALRPSGGEQDTRPLTVLVNWEAGLKK